MTDSALVRAKFTCLSCGSPVPSPVFICFNCGGAPLVSEPNGEWSVTLDPVPSAKMRRDVAALVASLFPGVDAGLVETNLQEGKPVLWLTAGLGKASADALVARFRAMHAPAAAHHGVPPFAARRRSPVPAYALAGVGGIVALWSVWVGLLLIAAAIAVWVALSPRKSAPLALPEAGVAPDPILAASVRGLLGDGAAKATPVGATADVVRESGKLFTLLADERNALAYVAGGVDGRVGTAAKLVIARAANIQAGVRNRANSDVENESLQRLSSALRTVHADLSALAEAPDEEPDIAARLEANVRKLETAAGE